MRPLFQIFLSSVFAALIASFAGPAFSDEPPTPKPAPAAEGASPSEMSEGFVDRDGDGIADGKEHRFRKRSKRRTQDGNRQMKQKRNKNKGARGNSPQSR